MTSVEIRNRQDCCADRLAGAQVFAGDHFCGTLNADPQSVVQCAAAASKVRISKPNEGYLTLCEVTVSGTMLQGQLEPAREYEFLFYGCPRGSLASSWEEMGALTLAECAAKCDGNAACTVIEVNGCLRAPALCGGLCYHFFGSGDQIRNGNCVTSGDQLAFRKPRATPASATAAPAADFRGDGTPAIDNVLVVTMDPGDYVRVTGIPRQTGPTINVFDLSGNIICHWNSRLQVSTSPLRHSASVSRSSLRAIQADEKDCPEVGTV